MAAERERKEGADEGLAAEKDRTAREERERQLRERERRLQNEF